MHFSAAGALSFTADPASTLDSEGLSPTESQEGVGLSGAAGAGQRGSMPEKHFRAAQRLANGRRKQFGGWGMRSGVDVGGGETVGHLHVQAPLSAVG